MPCPRRRSGAWARRETRCDIVLSMPDSQDDRAQADRDLTLTERVEWVNSYERSLRRENGGLVLELRVYPLADDRTLPAPDFPRSLADRVRRFVTGPG